MKTCTRCAETKALTEFFKQASQKSGLNPRCKACAKVAHQKHYAANREKLLEQMRVRHAENPQIVRDRMAAWVKANPERHAANRARWVEANPEKVRTASREHAAKYRAVNKDKKAAWQNRRRASKVGATTAWEPELDHLVEQEAASLAKLREQQFGFGWHIDHTVPLRGKTVCGLHNAYNLAVLPAVENMQKHNRYWPDMPC